MRPIVGGPNRDRSEAPSARPPGGALSKWQSVLAILASLSQILRTAVDPSMPLTSRMAWIAGLGVVAIAAGLNLLVLFRRQPTLLRPDGLPLPRRHGWRVQTIVSSVLLVLAGTAAVWGGWRHQRRESEESSSHRRAVRLVFVAPAVQEPTLRDYAVAVAQRVDVVVPTDSILRISTDPTSFPVLTPPDSIRRWCAHRGVDGVILPQVLLLHDTCVVSIDLIPGSRVSETASAYVTFGVTTRIPRSELGSAASVGSAVRGVETLIAAIRGSELARMGNWRASADVTEQAILDLGPQERSNNLLVRCLQVEAVASAESGDSSRCRRAIRTLERMYRDSPDSMDFAPMAALCAYKLDDPGEAFYWLYRQSASDPLREVRLAIAGLMCVQSSDSTLARLGFELLRRTAQYKRDSLSLESMKAMHGWVSELMGPGYYERERGGWPAAVGYGLCRSKRFQEAIPYLSIAARRDHENPYVYLWRAIAFCKTGHPGDGLTDTRRAYLRGRRDPFVLEQCRALLAGFGREAEASRLTPDSGWPVLRGEGRPPVETPEIWVGAEGLSDETAGYWRIGLPTVWQDHIWMQLSIHPYRSERYLIRDPGTVGYVRALLLELLGRGPAQARRAPPGDPSHSRAAGPAGRAVVRALFRGSCGGPPGA